MWERIALFVLRFRLPLLVIILVLTAFMGWHASKVQLSYEFTKAIPLDNPKYKAYQDFKKQFGEDGNLLVIGFKTNNLFEENLFNDYAALAEKLTKTTAVIGVLSIPGATNLVKDTLSEKLIAIPVFPSGHISQLTLDSSRDVFLNLKFYNGLLYNSESHSYLIGASINKDVLNSKKGTML